MARVMTIEHATIPAAERAPYLAGLAGRRAHYRDARCRFWVFEEVEMPGQFIEFAEAADAAALTAARAAAAGRPLDPVRVYAEVEVE